MAGLNVKTVHFTFGEHDGSLGKGTEYKEHFGPSNYAFEHNGVHFIASITCSPDEHIGDAQLEWLKSNLHKLLKDVRDRRQEHCHIYAIQQLHGVLWPYPPRPSPHDGANRPSRRQVSNLSLANARFSGKTLAVAMGARRTKQGTRLPRGGSGS